MGGHLVDGEYQPYELHADFYGGVWAHSELLNLDFHWTQEMFRVRDPISGEDINTLSEERDARLAAAAHAQEVAAELERLHRHVDSQDDAG